MINNDVLRRIRYIFDFNDLKMVEIFGLSGAVVDREEVRNWLKKEDDPQFQILLDLHLANFLNGLIILKRGNKETKEQNGNGNGGPPVENRLTNNIILRKIMIALSLKSDDVLKIMELAEWRFSQHELSAFFRKKTHKHYRNCMDQVLRNFLKGLQLLYRKN